MVTKVGHIPQAARCTAALAVRRPHVGRVLADDIGESSLIFVHLLFACSGVELIQTRMRPGVRANLMTIDSHASDYLDPFGSSINLASATAVAHNEEGAVDIVGFKQVKKGCSTVRRAIVES